MKTRCEPGPPYTLEGFQGLITDIANLVWAGRAGKDLGRDARPEELVEIEAEVRHGHEEILRKALAYHAREGGYSRRGVAQIRRSLRFLSQLQRLQTPTAK